MTIVAGLGWGPGCKSKMTLDGRRSVDVGPGAGTHRHAVICPTVERLGNDLWAAVVAHHMDRPRIVFGSLAIVIVTVWAFAPTDTTGAASTGDVYNPVIAGEPLPDGFRQVLPRDAIMPIYDPQFVPGSAIDWPADTLVIGVAAGEEAKSYPVSFLNGREMVVDSINGIPILVTW